MNEKYYYLYFIIVGLLIGMLIGLNIQKEPIIIQENEELSIKYEKIHTAYTEVLLQNRKYKEMELVLYKLNQVHRNHNYTENFKCLNFSYTLQEELREIDINSSVVWGYITEEDKENKQPHAWNKVCIDLDATSNWWWVDRKPYEYKGEWKG
jgi:hypothetical protein